jgi:hypothetical protein
MPDNFVAEKQLGLLSAPIRYTGDPASDPLFRTGNVTFENASKGVAGSCYYNVPFWRALQGAMHFDPVSF